MNQTDEPSTATVSPPAQERSRPRSRWLQVGILLVVFGAGVIVGAVVAAKVIHSRMQQMRDEPDLLRRQIVARLRGQLGLSAEQSKQVEAIVLRRHSRIVEIRGKMVAETHAEFDAMEREIAAVLDETQAGEWRKIADQIQIRYLPTASGSGNP